MEIGDKKESMALTNLDLAFILDCTDSMDFYIDHAKEVRKSDHVTSNVLKTCILN